MGSEWLTNPFMDTADKALAFLPTQINKERSLMTEQGKSVEYTVEILVTIWPKAEGVNLNGAQFESGVSGLTYFEANNAVKGLEEYMEKLRNHD